MSKLNASRFKVVFEKGAAAIFKEKTFVAVVNPTDIIYVLEFSIDTTCSRAISNRRRSIRYLLVDSNGKFQSSEVFIQRKQSYQMLIQESEPGDHYRLSIMKYLKQLILDHFSHFVYLYTLQNKS